MVLGIMDRAVRGKSRRDERPAAQVRVADATRAVPRVEMLEPRCVPAATRPLPGFLTNSLVRQDDAPSNSANVGFTLNYFGVVTDTVFVNNNGNITFNTGLSQFTPSSLNSNNGGIPIIAPFFADVDTRPAASGVTTYGTDTFCGRRVFGVNWFNVGYFTQHVDKLNTFQLMLVDRSDTGVGNFDIEFNYDTILWETGDASGGTNGFGGSSARVGYTNGSGAPGTFFEVPGSGTNGAFLDNGSQALIRQRLLSSTPGRLHFIVRNGQVLRDITGNLEITGATRQFRPFRFLYDQPTQTFRGNLTVLNVGGTISAGDACLDLFASDLIATGSFGGPVTLVFNNLPPGVQVVNRTGVTASGLSYLTQPLDTFRRSRPLRVPIVLTNPRNEHLGTFFQGFSVRVFAGTFDPTTV